MIVCSCNAISETKIRDSLHSEKSPRTPGAVYKCLGCSPNCGRCYATVQSIIKDALGQAEEHAHSREGTLKRFKEEWASHADPAQGPPAEEHCACAAGCACCRAAGTADHFDLKD